MEYWPLERDQSDKKFEGKAIITGGAGKIGSILEIFKRKNRSYSS